MAGKGDKRRVEDFKKVQSNWDEIDWSGNKNQQYKCLTCKDTGLITKVTRYGINTSEYYIDCPDCASEDCDHGLLNDIGKCMVCGKMFPELKRQY